MAASFQLSSHHSVGCSTDDNSTPTKGEERMWEYPTPRSGTASLRTWLVNVFLLRMLRRLNHYRLLRLAVPQSRGVIGSRPCNCRKRQMGWCPTCDQSI